ncbi:hypothetical protein [Ponticoccus litoralis]|uniref:SH3 domain-containing protein n=1 Tax=Ponticoccus litoralis TaxID=422297 RepID=A0AAW9SMZ9_9RHOB
MKRSLMTALVLVTALSGCGQMRSFVGDWGGGNAPPSQLPAPDVAGPPYRWRNPRRAIRSFRPSRWDGATSLRRDIPYVNMTARNLPIYKEADRSAKAGSLSPGMGGYVETCSDAAPVCKIRYGANGASGWVRMDQMGGVTN